MGTIPLVESVLDPRNAATLAAVVVLGLLCHTALTSNNRQQATVLTMVLYLLSFHEVAVT